MIRLVANSSHMHKKPRTRKKGVHTLVPVIVVAADRGKRRPVVGMSGHIVVHGGDENEEASGVFGLPV